MLDKHLTNEEKLDEIYRMTLENHEVLKTIRRQQYFSGAMRALYWLIVLGVIGGSYYYVRPFIGAVSNNSSQIESYFSQFKNQLPETKVFNQVLDGLNKKNTEGTSSAQP